MLRILDARTGEPVAAAPARRGLTRIEAYASSLDLAALRVLLTADLLVRALELGGTPVWATLTAPREQPELRAAATTLAIRPFEDGRDLASGLGASQAIHVLSETPATALGEGPVVTVAPVTWREPRPPASADDRAEGRGTGAGPAAGGSAEGARAAGADGEGGTVAEAASGAGASAEAVPGHEAAPAADVPAETGRESSADAGSAGIRSPVPDRDAELPASQPPLPALLADPAPLRLALLSVPRSETVRLDRTVLDGAARRLAEWRRAVAGWARQPSRPVPEEVRGRLRAAWEDDLDLPGVLAVLGYVASAPGLPDGARFETFAYTDRLLALDLARDLGSLA